MGLTRYWSRPPLLDPERFLEWSADCRAILDTARLPSDFRPALETSAQNPPRFSLRGPDGTGQPVTSGSCIAFNGDASTRADHEPFVVYRNASVLPGHRTDQLGRIREYCKTSGKPYDAAVDACLIALRIRFGAAVSVDVDAAGRDLDAGAALHAEAIGRG